MVAAVLRECHAAAAAAGEHCDATQQCEAARRTTNVEDGLSARKATFESMRRTNERRRESEGGEQQQVPRNEERWLHLE